MSVVEYKGMKVDPTRLNESVTIQLPSASKGSLKESFGQGETISPRIEAIHAGTTKNYMYYPAEKLKGDKELKSGVHSWTSPYAKPVIFNHDTDTEVTGRVERAAYADYTQAGKPGIIVVPRITQPEAVKAVKDGRLLTVSIGGTTDAAVCSICETDIINEGFCGHMKGEVYDGVTATWIAGNIWFDELSWVNVPADENAMVVEVETNTLGQPTSEEKEVEEKAEKTLHEFYQLPKTVTVIEAVAESLVEEGSEKMADKETKDAVFMEDIIEVGKHLSVEAAVEAAQEDAEVVADEEVVEDEEVVQDEDNSEVKTDEEDPADEAPEPEVEEVEPEVKPETQEADTANDVLVTENKALLAQVEALTEELRKEYEQKVLTEMNLEEDAKEKFATRLEGRSLTSLKEMLEDIKEGFYKVEKPVVEEKAARKTKKVESPIKESEEATRKITESERVNFFTNMFNTK